MRARALSSASFCVSARQAADSKCENLITGWAHCFFLQLPLTLAISLISAFCQLSLHLFLFRLLMFLFDADDFENYIIKVHEPWSALNKQRLSASLTMCVAVWRCGGVALRRLMRCRSHGNGFNYAAGTHGHRVKEVWENSMLSFWRACPPSSIYARALINSLSRRLHVKTFSSPVAFMDLIRMDWTKMKKQQQTK